MKKLLSICFLSIFLMMFSAQAQTDCCFYVSNPAADTIHGVVNMPNGDLPLTHSVTVPVNGSVGIYDLVFPDCSSIDADTTKVSIEFELWCDGENILDGRDLRTYCDITVQTYYNELQWVGTPMLSENYPNVYEYPGARRIYAGTYPISDVAFDYFFYNFLMNTQTQLVINWHRAVRDVKLIVNIRQRIGGTNNEFYWNENQNLNLGGHWSHLGDIIGGDTLTTDTILEFNRDTMSCDPVVVGQPPYTMDTTGLYDIAYVSCGNKIDSLVHYNFTRLPQPATPTLSDDTISYCEKAEALPIVLPVDTTMPLAARDSVFTHWSLDGSNFFEQDSLVPTTDSAGTYTYYVKRVVHGTGCESGVDTFLVVINPLPSAPVVADSNRIIEYCVGNVADTLVYTVTTPGWRVIWGTSLDDLKDTIYVPETTAADTIIYFLKLQDTTTVNGCVSEDYDSVIVRIFDNPVVHVSAVRDSVCFADTAFLSVTPTDLTTYQWLMDTVAITGATDTNYAYVNGVAADTTIKFVLKATKEYDEAVCKAKDSINIFLFGEIGAPTLVSGPDTVCSGQEATFKVALGANATSVKWYAADKNTVLGTDTTYTATFTVTDTLYVASENDFGCHTLVDSMLQIIVTVDTLPSISISAANNNKVCAESNMILHCVPVDPSYTYAWRGDSLVGALDLDSVIFNSSVAGTFHDTLTVTDAYGHGCSKDTVITITVNPLPVIVKDINYTIQDNSYCKLPGNGEIIFTTPKYVRYSLDSAANWSTDSAFLNLKDSVYYLAVEDTNGCRSHIVPDTVKDAKADIKVYLSMTPNTHCSFPYGGTISVDSVTPASLAYHYKLEGDTTIGYQFDTLFVGLKHNLTTPYRVTAEDTTTKCFASDTITVTSTQILPGAIVTSRKEVCLYEADTTLLTMTPALTDTNVVFDYWEYQGTSPMFIDSANIQKDSIYLNYNMGNGVHPFIAHFHDTVTNCENTVMDSIRIISVNLSFDINPLVSCEYDTVQIQLHHNADRPLEDSLVYLFWNAREWGYVSYPDTTFIWARPSVDNKIVNVVAKDNHGCYNSKALDLQVRQLPTRDLTINYDNQYYCLGSMSDSLYVVLNKDGISTYTFAWEKEGGITLPSTDSTCVVPVDSNFNAVVTVTSQTLIHTSIGYTLLNCSSKDTIPVHVVQMPNKPKFAFDTLYFCDNNVYVDTIQDTLYYGAAGMVGDFYWVNDINPNDVALTGTYYGYFVNKVTAGSHEVSCYSTNDSVFVKITDAPRFTVDMKYNGVSATSEERCYTSTTLTEELSFTVNLVTPGPTPVYTYTLNGTTATPPFDIHRTEPGTYKDTINISVEATYGSGAICDWDTTVYFTLKVDSLPVAPDNFPSISNGYNDSIIYYCEGSTADYNFNFDPRFNYSYSPGGSVKPTTEGAYYLVVENATTHCVDSFPYAIVKVLAPIDTILSKANGSDNCALDEIKDTIVAKIKNADPSYTKFFVWNYPDWTTPDSVAKSIDSDTLYYTFKATDTMVTVRAGVYVANGDYTATCYKTPANDTIKVLFQDLPAMPKLDPAYTYYKDSAHVEYCASEYHNGFALDSTNFLPIAGAKIRIVGHSGPGCVDTAGVYQVVANNIASPGCPGDTLTIYVREKRTPVIPVFDTVYYCAGTQAVYTITPVDPANDTIIYYNGTTPIDTPKTAGVYTLHILDKIDSCTNDTTLVIVEVPLPTATITNSVNWHNDTICEGTILHEVYTFTITPYVQPGHDTIQTFTWKDIVSTTNTATLDATPTADTSVAFFYHLIDTIGNSYSQAACAFDFDSTIKYMFLAKPAVPVYLGDTLFCEGDSIVVGVDSFYLATASTELYTTTTLPVTYNTPGNYTFDVQSQYTYYTSCKSTVNTIIINGYDLPNLSVGKTKDKICFEGDTSVFTASSLTTGTYFVWEATDTIASINVTDTVWHHVQAIEDHGCINKDSAKITYHPVFSVTLSRDTIVCKDSLVTISANITGTGTFTLTWYKNDDPAAIFGSPIPGVTSDSQTFTPDPSVVVNGVPEYTKYKLEVEDENHCVMDKEHNVISIAATNIPGFKFYVGGVEQDTMKVKVKDARSFDFIVTNECHDETEKVFIGVQIFKNGVAVTDAEWGECLNNIGSSSYNTEYDFDVNIGNAPLIYSPSGTYASHTGSSSYYFPNNAFVSTFNDKMFDWIYMHFLVDRKVTVKTGAWQNAAKGDTITFNFTIVKAGPSAAENMVNYVSGRRVGGFNGRVSCTYDVVSAGSFTIYVDTVNVGLGGDNFNSQATVTPAPEEETVETKPMSMNVYPNPASNNVNVVLEGITGQTVITVHDMSGKAVSSMRVDVDNNGQVFNLPVDNYSQGIYFIKAVNGSAVMTKKLIIAR